MSPARLPMQPPAIEGYEFGRLLGSGGYSDVFLYHQQLPQREVAIKVLVTEGLGDVGREQFQLEANAMASVSTHPYIVTVFHAGVSELGQPYLVMECYPQPNFSVRARNEQLAIAEVLRVGIQVASAVETAHRAGILHRDIKPANILTSEYNRPGLTDFGIATSVAEGVEAQGMSIPWAPPEVINASAPGDTTADVYSLGATIYTLLAGRSPFEVTGGANTSLDLVARIEKGDPPPTGRPDVPSSLERVLRHSMSMRPQDRPASALDLARMLQAVEIEQGWSTTQLEVRDDSRKGRVRDTAPDDDGTRLKSPMVIDSQQGRQLIDRVDASNVGSTVARGGARGDSGTIARLGSGASAPLIQGVGSRPTGLVQSMPTGGSASTDLSPADDKGAIDGAAQIGASAPTTSRAERTPGERRSRRTALAAAIAVLAVALAGGVGAALWPTTTTSTTSTTSTVDTLPPPPAVVPAPHGVTLSDPAGDQQRVTWEHDVEDLSLYDYLVEPSEESAPTVRVSGVNETTLTIEGAGAQCVTVVAIATGSGRSSDTTDPRSEGCVR